MAKNGNSMKKGPKINENIFKFFEIMSKNQSSTWSDKYGNYEVFIFKGGAEKKIKEFKNANFLVADFLCDMSFFQCYFDREELEFPEILVSIGSFDVHNLAKQQGSLLNSHLVTIPLPLANDSFGTNRCNLLGNPSFQCIYPNITIIDTYLLSQFKPKENLNGIGEFVGLYFSIIDYCITRNLLFPVDILLFISNNLEVLVRLYYEDYEQFLRRLSVLLVFKCLVMRTSESHQIGCGLDHLFAGHIEEVLKIPHGKAVYIGCILAFVLNPAFKKFGFSLVRLIQIGLKLNWINTKEIIPFLDYRTIVKAVETRSNRITVLNGVRKENCELAFERIYDILKRKEPGYGKHRFEL